MHTVGDKVAEASCAVGDKVAEASCAVEVSLVAAHKVAETSFAVEDKVVLEYTIPVPVMDGADRLLEVDRGDYNFDYKADQVIAALRYVPFLP
ncbi:hypothetical protein KDW_42430 [Dictyobacter vulcani]|uniref:Uncharacterized protein n=1 Tax=Dictyobacter vulcani TaxID=2607529 RepID=A0A5J4KUA5_9CHLR|nr:hypothetical protein KDW_42430 [Dictyobacter vulcani]